MRATYAKNRDLETNGLTIKQSYKLNKMIKRALVKHSGFRGMIISSQTRLKGLKRLSKYLKILIINKLM